MQITLSISILKNKNKVLTFTENQSIYKPTSEVHRISNTWTNLLEIIEVRAVSHLGKYDIDCF